jgi:serine/threonine protein kinase
MANAPMRSAARENALHPKLPLQLGRFMLCEELGSGGMATVYLARMDLAAGLERLVALKTIHPHLAKEKAFVDMFLDEARIASHVSHPNVCAVHDFGELDGVYYLAMEHLVGEPLFDVINRMVDRFDDVKEVLPYVAARVIADACEGLHAAHTARGPDGNKLSIVHRDVSPQNLFVSYDGAVKVVDFGCAKAAQRVAHTSTGVMKGKVGYAAPEQLRADDVDHRADVWALGVCLWEALTLSPLFTKDTAMATAMSVLDAPIPSAAADREWVPEGAAKIAEKALQRKREDRYASARDMGRDLRKFIADSGFTLEAAELAEWMDFLFDDKHEEREAQVARVRALDVSHARRANPELLSHEDVVMIDEPSQPSEASLEAPDTEEDVAPPAAPPALPSALPPAKTPPALPAKSAEPPREEAPPSSRKWLIAAVTIVGLAIGAYYLNLYYAPAPWLTDLFGVGGPSETPRTASQPPETDDGEPASPERQAPEAQTDETPDTPEVQPEAQPAETQAPATEQQPSGERPRRREGGGSGIVTVVSSGTPSEPQPVHDRQPIAQPTVEPPAEAMGTVRIEAVGGGWAAIYLNGRRLGQTPLTRDLPVGRHRLRVLPYDREPAEYIPVEVEPGVEASLSIEVAPE